MYPKWLRTAIQCYQNILSIRIVRHTRNVLLILALSLSLSSLASAQTATNDKPAQVNQQEAIAKAKQSVKGKVLKVDRNKEHYRVKMLNQKGRVISVNVNKQSGKVMPKAAEKTPAKQDKD